MVFFDLLLNLLNHNCLPSKIIGFSVSDQILDRVFSHGVFFFFSFLVYSIFAPSGPNTALFERFLLYRAFAPFSGETTGWKENSY